VLAPQLLDLWSQLGISLLIHPYCLCCNCCLSCDCVQGDDDCNVCKNVKDGSHCREKCPPLMYENEERECVQCHALCQHSCTGPLGILGPGACSACHVVVYNSSKPPLAPLHCAPLGSKCPDRFHERTTHVIPGTETKECYPCNKLCSSCVGPSTDTYSCTKCDGYINTDDMENEERCVATCPMHKYIDAASRKCRPCDPLCAHCHGPSTAECSKCKFVAVFADPEKHDQNTPFNCSELCPDWAPAEIAEKWTNHTQHICVTTAMFATLHGTSRLHTEHIQPSQVACRRYKTTKS
jgi:hypothetical protein